MRARTLREGSVGLMVLGGLVVLGALAVFARGAGLRGDRLRFTINFEDVNRLGVGAPVRFRGLQVGNVSKMTPIKGGVDVEVVVAPRNIDIPLDAEFTINQSGLIGESSVDIYKAGTFDFQPAPQQPLKRGDCDAATTVVCPGDLVQGYIGTSLDVLLRDSAKLTEALNENDLAPKLASALTSFTSAADQVTVLGEELVGVTDTIETEVENLTAAVTDTAGEIRSTNARLEELIVAVNELVTENREEVAQILENVQDASGRLSHVLAELTPAVEKIGDTIASADTDKLVAELQTVTSNAAVASENLREFSEGINDPENIVKLQETLNSARATFANAEKITADIDELTGDPELRRNLRDLVNGLSDLVSSAEALERQLQVAQTQNLSVTQP